MSNCKNLTDDAIIGLADRCQAITDINASYCQNLTDEAIIGLGDRCSAIIGICAGMASMIVSYCENLTDDAIIGLADGCPAITRIYVSCCENLTDAVLSLSLVLEIDVFGCYFALRQFNNESGYCVETCIAVVIGNSSYLSHDTGATRVILTRYNCYWNIEHTVSLY